LTMNANKINFFDAGSEKIIAIGEKIIHQHTSLGPYSPINNVVIADLHSRISSAKAKHDEAMKYKKLMEAALNERDYFLGSHDKSVAYTLTAIANILSSENQVLNDWGLNEFGK
jgi:hypothetical protein